MRTVRRIVWAVTLLIVSLAGLAPLRADFVTLDFQDIPIPGDTDSAPFFSYSSQGYNLVAINPPSGFESGFQAHGANSAFWAGAVGVVPFAPASSPPGNVITLSRVDGNPFSMLSIDLARNFPFDPAPTVTFVGALAGGGSVSQSFTVTVPIGDRAFQTFALTGFSQVLAVSWEQPQLADGLHQFTNIELASVPEPSSLALLAAGAVTLAIVRWRRPRRTAG